MSISIPTNHAEPAPLEYHGQKAYAHRVFENKRQICWAGKERLSGMCFIGNTIEEAAEQFKRLVDAREMEEKILASKDDKKQSEPEEPYNFETYSDPMLFLTLLFASDVASQLNKFQAKITLEAFRKTAADSAEKMSKSAKTSTITVKYIDMLLSQIDSAKKEGQI